MGAKHANLAHDPNRSRKYLLPRRGPAGKRKGHVLAGGHNIDLGAKIFGDSTVLVLHRSSPIRVAKRFWRGRETIVGL